MQETVVKEAASLLDASVRAALTDAIDATPLLPHKLSGEEADGPLRNAIAGLRNLPGPARAALLPLTGGVEAAAALAETIAPLVKADERDRKVLGAAEKIGGLVSGDGDGSVDPQKVVEALSTSDVDLTPETARRAGLVGRRFAAAVLDRAAERAHGAGGVGETLASAARQASDAVRPAAKPEKEEVAP